MDIFQDTKNKKVKVTFTLDSSIDQSLKELIKTGDKSQYVNQVLGVALKKEAIKDLNEKLKAVVPIKPDETSLTIIRELRGYSDSRNNG